MKLMITEYFNMSFNKSGSKPGYAEGMA